MDYGEFLASKAQVGTANGFEPLWVPDFLKDFQRHLTEWAIRKGRGAIAADCGMGKTPIMLVCGQNVVRKMNGRFLILTPLAVAPQFVTEGEKFGVGVKHSKDGKVGGSGVYVTNYERLHLFDPNHFAGVGCDEAGILKNFDGKTKAATIEFLRTRPYRFLAGATMAPNDYTELGNSAEALGELGYQDMLSKFFKVVTGKEKAFKYRGWGHVKYRLREYATRDFWRWVCSWMRVCRKPSDLGPFDDSQFVLPELVTNEHEVQVTNSADGKLFDTPAVTLHGQRDEQRRSIQERCEKVAELVRHQDQAVCWCHLNDEGDLLERMISDCEQVSGRDSEDEKEEKLIAFQRGQIRVLVTKPKIAGFGLNFQNCGHQTFFPSHSFEQWHQCVHRSVRFGRTEPVVVDIVTTAGAECIKDNLERKRKQADAMFAELVSLMNDGLKIDRTGHATTPTEVPSWLNAA
jgi:hypothetical protein